MERSFKEDEEYLTGISGDNSEYILHKKIKLLFLQKIIVLSNTAKMTGNYMMDWYITLYGTLDNYEIDMHPSSKIVAKVF